MKLRKNIVKGKAACPANIRDKIDNKKIARDKRDNGEKFAKIRAELAFSRQISFVTI